MNATQMMEAHAFLGAIYDEAYNEIERAKNLNDEDAAFIWKRGNLYVYGEVSPSGWKNVEVCTRSLSFRDFPALQAAVESILPDWDEVEYDEEQAADRLRMRWADDFSNALQQIEAERGFV